MKSSLFFMVILLFSSQIICAQEDENELSEIRGSIKIDSSQNFRKDLKDVSRGHFGDNILDGQRDGDSGLEISYNTFKDKNRINFSLLFNADIKDLTDIFYAEFAFGFFDKENRYFDIFVNTQSNTYGSMSARASDISTDSEVLDKTKESFFSFGAGPTLRTYFIRDLIPIKNIFETIHTGAALGWFFEESSNEGYFGPGIKADLGIHYRASKNLHIGTKMSWSHFWVKRDEKFVDEPQGVRTLSLTWLAFGIDLAFYL